MFPGSHAISICNLQISLSSLPCVSGGLLQHILQYIYCLIESCKAGIFVRLAQDSKCTGRKYSRDATERPSRHARQQRHVSRRDRCRPGQTASTKVDLHVNGSYTHHGNVLPSDLPERSNRENIRPPSTIILLRKKTKYGSLFNPSLSLWREEIIIIL